MTLYDNICYKIADELLDSHQNTNKSFFTPNITLYVDDVQSLRQYCEHEYVTTNIVITVAMKLPVDLTSDMPGEMNQVAKLGSLAFMCTVMANLMPSLASTDNKTLLANVIGLSILVITVIINIIIQINTGVIDHFPIIRKYIHYIDCVMVMYIYLAMITLLLTITISSSLTIPTSKEILEFKYQATNKTSPTDQQQTQMSKVEKLRQDVRRFWVMAETGGPQFVMASSPLSTACGVICVVVLLMQSLLMIDILNYYHKYEDVYPYRSVYKRSILFIFVTQFIGVVMGTITPMFRCFSVLSFKLVTKWDRNHFMVFKVEKYWTQKLYEWKQNHLPILLSSRRSRNILYNLKTIVLSLCIGFQKVLVVLCKVISLIPIVVLKLVVYCLYSLKAKLFTPPIESRTGEINEYLSKYVLQIHEEMELAERTLKGISNSMNSFILKAQKEQDNGLLELLAKSTGFDGVATMALWHEVENKRKWLKNSLSKNAFEGKTATEILKWFANKAEEIVIEISKSSNGIMVEDNIPKEFIASNSMYRIAETILLRECGNSELLSKKQLFLLLNGMIADIFSACFTNIPQVIEMRSHESVIEKREASVRVAAKLLGIKVSYGIAGFRADASILQSTVFRIGILAALRSLKCNGDVIGLMITASHNKVDDNGVKIADPSGGMLSQDWEPFADQIANAQDAQSFLQLITEFVKKENIPLDGAKQAVVLLGRDTRPSGESLLRLQNNVFIALFFQYSSYVHSINIYLLFFPCVILPFTTSSSHTEVNAHVGICSIIGAVPIDMGVVTTPQLHWMVRARNKDLKASELDYFDQLSTSFRCLIDLIPNKGGDNHPIGKLVVDCSNGVGGEKLQVLKEKLNWLDIEIRNSGKEGVLNEGVGADFVQKEKVVPQGFGPLDVGVRCASLDGDADRFVYFTVISNGNNKINLEDGDKILSLFALFIKDQLNILIDDKDIYQPRVGVIQTAYANGASTKYLNQLGLEVVFTPTGVKYLHEKAEEYDIDIYFEANGHGTILFSEHFLNWLEGRKSTEKGLEKQNAAKRLWAVTKLINQAVGDALNGLLLVEAILQHMGWSVDKWNELYHDLPSRQLKVKVADRTAVVTTNAETTVEKPTDLQEAITALTVNYPQGRCFVRPSGTEDIARVYAEANIQEAADELASSVSKVVDQFLGFSSS
ncbi:phosphoglucosamine mutase [Artemisia annua]|uniref:Phosphoacetylglucosamine mutase n=1 Tax=Artemisia annua TaxID=35608 RepID=A0A2U1KHR9_ARTAN|nr:phosphoglucosamine mutase [Artemisia annua]